MNSFVGKVRRYLRQIIVYSACFAIVIISMAFYSSITDSLRIHSTEIANLYRNDYDRKILELICTVMCVLLSATGVTIPIVNAFMEKQSKQRELYLYKCAGVSCRGYIRKILRDLLFCIGISLPMGVGIGLITVVVSVRLIGMLMTSWIGLSVRPLALFISAVVCVIYLSLISLIPGLIMNSKVPMSLNNSTVIKTSFWRIAEKHFPAHPIAVRGIRNLISNSSDYAATVLGTVAVFLSSSVVCVVFSLMISFFSNSMTFDYELKTGDNAFFSLLSIPAEYNCFSSDELNSLESDKNVRECYALSSNEMYIILSESDDPVPVLYASDMKSANSYSNEALTRFLDQCKEFGYSDSERLFSFTLWGVNDQLWNMLTGKMPSECGYNLVVLTSQNAEQYYMPGDTVNVSAPRLSAEGTVIRKDIELTVGMTPKISDTEAEDFFADNYSRFIVPYSLIENNLGNGYNKICIRLKNSEMYEDTQKTLVKIIDRHKDELKLEFLSQREENIKRTGIRLSLSAIVFNISIILFAFMASSLYVTIRNDLYGKKRMWGYLRAASMSKKQGIETELVTMFGCVALGVLFSSVLCAVICFSVPDLFSELREYWSWKAIVYPLVTLLVCITATTIEAVNRFWAVPVVKLLQTE